MGLLDKIVYYVTTSKEQRLKAKQLQKAYAVVQNVSHMLAFEVPKHLPKENFEHGEILVNENDKKVTKVYARHYRHYVAIRKDIIAHVWIVKCFGEVSEEARSILKDKWEFEFSKSRHFAYATFYNHKEYGKVLAFYLVKRKPGYTDDDLRAMVSYSIGKH